MKIESKSKEIEIPVSEIGELISKIMKMGFEVSLFNRWPIKSKNEAENGETGKMGGCEIPPTSPIFYCGIQSNQLRESPLMNGSCLHGDSLHEVLKKSHAVAKYIIDNSEPIS